jgi:hypothetical protein
MSHRAKESEAAKIVESYENRVEHRVSDEIVPIKHSIKDEYKDQFEKAIEVAQHHLKQGFPKRKLSIY